MNKIETLFKEWQSLQPVKEEYQQRLDQKFMLEFNYNSNHIEGNTLTYGQTELLLLFGRVVGEAKMKDLEEMKAHNVCLKMTIAEAGEKDRPLTESFIRILHQTMLREDYTVYRQLPGGVNTSYVVHAGCYKTRPNSVITPTGERFEYASPEETPALMTDLIQWYNQAEADGKLTPVELAAMFHYRYIRIHPFEDGNGRIARLLMNYILLRHGYPMIVIRSKNKKAYLEALGKADKNIGPVPSDGANATLEQAQDFVNYIIKQVEQTLEDDINFLQEKEDAVWWFDGEFVKFNNDTTIQLLKYLVDHPQATVKELAQVLSINKSAVQKQLETLQRKGYVTRVGTRKEGKRIVNLVSTTPKGGK
ncbi:MAG: Fic family protein [Bacteroidales bacterium]|nr:Fic family protein [Bacteroidales bacterium]